MSPGRGAGGHTKQNQPTADAGWIKLWRRARENPWLRDAVQRAIFLTLLMDAETEPHERRHSKGVVKVGRGQCLVSERALSEELNIGREPTRRALRNLKKGGLINPQTNPHYTLVTICNYDRYQARIDDDQPTDQPTIQPTTNPPPNPTLRIEEEREGKNIPPSPSERIPPNASPNGSAGKPAVDPRGSRLKADWEPGEKGVAYARSLGMSDDAINETYHAFMRYWLAKAGKDARKVDWLLTWQTWVRRENERLREQADRERRLQERYGSRAAAR